MARPTYAQQDEDRMMEDDGVGGKASWSKQLKEVTETVLQSDVARDLTKKGITVGKQVGKQVRDSRCTCCCSAKVARIDVEVVLMVSEPGGQALELDQGCGYGHPRLQLRRLTCASQVMFNRL